MTQSFKKGDLSNLSNVNLPLVIWRNTILAETKFIAYYILASGFWIFHFKARILELVSMGYRGCSGMVLQKFKDPTVLSMPFLKIHRLFFLSGALRNMPQAYVKFQHISSLTKFSNCHPIQPLWCKPWHVWEGTCCLRRRKLKRIWDWYLRQQGFKKDHYDLGYNFFQVFRLNICYVCMLVVVAVNRPATPPPHLSTTKGSLVEKLLIWLQWQASWPQHGHHPKGGWDGRAGPRNIGYFN